MTFNSVSLKLNKCNMHSIFFWKVAVKLKPFSATTIPPKKCCDILEGLTFSSGKLFSKSLKKHFLTRHGWRNTWIHSERICRLIENENNLIKSSIQQIERGFTLHTLCFNCSQFLLWTLNGWQEGNFASTSLSAPPKNTSDSIFTNITVSRTVVMTHVLTPPSVF